MAAAVRRLLCAQTLHFANLRQTAPALARLHRQGDRQGGWGDREGEHEYRHGLWGEQTCSIMKTEKHQGKHLLHGWQDLTGRLDSLEPEGGPEQGLDM